MKTKTQVINVTKDYQQITINEIPKLYEPNKWRVIWNSEQEDFETASAALTFCSQSICRRAIGVIQWNTESKTGEEIVGILTAQNNGEKENHN